MDGIELWYWYTTFCWHPFSRLRRLNLRDLPRLIPPTLLLVQGTADVCGVQFRKLVYQSVELLSLFLGLDAKSFFWELLLIGISVESFRRGKLIPNLSELSFLVLNTTVRI